MSSLKVSLFFSNIPRTSYTTYHRPQGCQTHRKETLYRFCRTARKTTGFSLSSHLSSVVSHSKQVHGHAGLHVKRVLLQGGTGQKNRSERGTNQARRGEVRRSLTIVPSADCGASPAACRLWPWGSDSPRSAEPAGPVSMVTIVIVITIINITITSSIKINSECAKQKSRCFPQNV